MESLRDPELRRQRLEEDKVHVLPLPEFAEALRNAPEYEKDGHTGVILMKTPEMRVVLEAVNAGGRLSRHTIHGPATLYVLEGSLDLDTEEGHFSAGAADMVVLPRNEQRSITSKGRSMFVLILAPED